MQAAGYGPEVEVGGVNLTTVERTLPFNRSMSIQGSDELRDSCSAFYEFAKTGNS
jgi:hypothetical protein